MTGDATPVVITFFHSSVGTQSDRLIRGGFISLEFPCFFFYLLFSVSDVCSSPHQRAWAGRMGEMATREIDLTCATIKTAISSFLVKAVSPDSINLNQPGKNDWTEFKRVFISYNFSLNLSPTLVRSSESITTIKQVTKWLQQITKQVCITSCY